MRLRLQNIGKISDADIKIDGITVIGGENDTGKSTVGKTLYSIFNGYHKVGHKIESERRDNVMSCIIRIQQRFYNDGLVPQSAIFDIVEFILNNHIVDTCSIDSLAGKIGDLFCEYGANLTINNLNDDDRNTYYKHVRRIKDIMDAPKDRILTNSLRNRFLAEFGFNPRNYYSEDRGIAELTIRSQLIRICFTEDVISDESDELNLQAEAVYIDDPSVVESRPSHPFVSGVSGMSHKERLRRMVFSTYRQEDNIADVLAADGINRVMQKVDEACGGNIATSGSGIRYKKPDDNVWLPMSSLSEGLKTFVVIKNLILNRSIEPNGVLILDEPEIHLHPKWQLVLAELIVLLQQEFDLHILLTTHSPYFLEAIETYSERHGISARCNYYLAENHGNTATIRCVNGETSKIYDKLAEPFQTLEDLEWQND